MGFLSEIEYVNEENFELFEICLKFNLLKNFPIHDYHSKNTIFFQKTLPVCHNCCGEN